MPLAFPEPRDELEAEGMKVLHAAIADRNKWMEETMKRLVPERIYRVAYYGKKRGQLLAKRWLDDNGFEVQQQGTTTRIVVKGKLVAEHNFNFTTPEPTQ